jgi:Tfp pilus assembly protein FimT
MEMGMICGSLAQQRSTHRFVRSLSHGFTALELVVVVAIGMILAAVAIPVVQNTLRTLAMRSAITSLTGAISSTRYQPIFSGCKTQAVFTKSSYSYQVQSQAPAINGQACLAAYAPVGQPVPLQGRGTALSADITLTFSPGGGATSTPAANPIQMTITFPGTSLPAKQIRVSTYGNITVTP